MTWIPKRGDIAEYRDPDGITVLRGIVSYGLTSAGNIHIQVRSYYITLPYARCRFVRAKEMIEEKP